MPSHPPKSTTSFPGQCFNYQQYGRRSQDCTNKRATLLVEESEEEKLIEERNSVCAFSDHVHYPTIDNDPDPDYGNDRYELPLQDSPNTIWGELPESRGEWSAIN